MSSDDVSPRVPAVPSVSSGPAVLRPSRAAYARAIRANLWLAIPLVVIAIIRVGLNWWLIPVFIVAIAAAFGGVVLYFRNARVEYAGGSYSVFLMFGVARIFTAAQVKVLVTVTSLQTVGLSPTSPQLIVIGQDEERILRLRGQTWEVEQFTLLANDLIAHGVANDAIRDPITPARLRARYPRSVSWVEAHPVAWALLIGLGIVAVLIAVVLAVVALAPA